jgi:hypothetical protein
MVAVKKFNGKKLLERRAAKPREVAEREEKFPPAHEQPEAVR